MERSRSREADGSAAARRTGSFPERRSATRYDRSGPDERTRKRPRSRTGGDGQHPLVRLQRERGNQAVKRAIRERVQPKLTVGRSDDAYEREADRMAERVMRTPAGEFLDGSDASAGPRIQRLCSTCRDRLRRGKALDCTSCETELRRNDSSEADRTVSIHRRESEGDADGGAAPPAVGDVLQSPGRPLDGGTRRFMEERFGHDFGGVRVHTGPQAVEGARSIGARAFTVGQRIAFDRGEYRPNTSAGRALLAHELTHVVQQRGREAPSSIQRKPESKPKPGTAAAGPKMEVQGSQHGAPCACLLVIHNDERYARQTAQLMHQHCAYNLILVQPDKPKRDITLPSGVEVDPNALFPRSVAEECLGNEVECKRKLKTLETSKDPQKIKERTQIQFFLSISQCSHSFSLPVIILHNNDLKDTEKYNQEKQKAGTDLSELKKDFEKPGTTEAEITKKSDEIKSELEALLDKTVGKPARKQLAIGKTGKTNIFRWCVSTDLSHCHIGDPENPDNVIWTTNMADFERLSQENVNVVLQSVLPTKSKQSESATDLSTLFLQLRSIVETRSATHRKALANERKARIQEIVDVLASLEDLIEHGDALPSDAIHAIIRIVGALVDILLILLTELGELLGTQLRTSQLRFVNIETPGLRLDKPLTADQRVSNYELVVTVLKSLGLHCCGKDPTEAEAKIKSSLREKGP